MKKQRAAFEDALPERLERVPVHKAFAASSENYLHGVSMVNSVQRVIALSQQANLYIPPTLFEAAGEGTQMVTEQEAWTRSHLGTPQMLHRRELGAQAKRRR